MTLRHKLADWISGGEYMRLMIQVSRFDATVERMWASDDALLAIIAEEKPTSNATVRRMARIAREALK